MTLRVLWQVAAHLRSFTAMKMSLSPLKPKFIRCSHGFGIDYSYPVLVVSLSLLACGVSKSLSITEEARVLLKRL